MNGTNPNSVIKIVGQVLFLGLIGITLLVFSNSPPYASFPTDQALIKISISHAGKVKGECRKRSPEELAKLSPNMRLAEDCPRERSVIELDVQLDGKVLFHGDLHPSGIKRDGTATVYRSFRLPPGRHTLLARMKDHVNLTDYNYIKQMEINLAPTQVFVIDFDKEAGGFVFR